MVDNDTLLSHLIPRITERTEDIAVEALGYILNKSPAARGALEYPVKADGLDSGLCRHDSSSEASETLKPGFRCCRCLLIATVRRRAPTTFPDYLPRLPSPTTFPDYLPRLPSPTTFPDYLPRLPSRANAAPLLPAGTWDPKVLGPAFRWDIHPPVRSLVINGRRSLVIVGHLDTPIYDLGNPGNPGDPGNPGNLGKTNSSMATARPSSSTTGAT